jgi:hypothetical protein
MEPPVQYKCFGFVGWLETSNPEDMILTLNVYYSTTNKQIFDFASPF